MDRQTEARRLAEELLADIETKQLKASDILLKSNRLARLTGNDNLLDFLALERSGYPNDGSATAWIGRSGRWANDEDGSFYSQPLAKLEASLEAARATLIALQGGGNYSGEYASVAGREHDQKITGQALVISTFSAICRQVVSVIYEMVVEIYHELIFSELQATLFDSVRERVDAMLVASSGSALNKIEKVSDRLRSGDAESVSQGLTTCRRLIDSCADYLFPGRDEPFEMGDGQSLKVGQQNVLNRLQAHCFQVGISKGRRVRLRRTLADLYERCSAATHAEVSVEEARFIFLQTYIALGELLTLREVADLDVD